MAELSEIVNIEDPNFYLDDPYPVISRMQSEAPVWHYEPLDMWVLTKYRDVQDVGREPVLFTTRNGFQLNDFRYGNVMPGFFPPEAEHLVFEDPPRHDELRRIVQPAFSPRTMTAMGERITEIARETLLGLRPGEEIDWAGAVSTPFPATVIAMLLGMPISDVGLILRWSGDIMKMGSVLGKEELDAVAASLAPMREYFDEHLARKRREPGGDDVVSALLTALDAGAINIETVHVFIGSIITAGSETARNVLAGGLAALAERPDQYRRLVEDPSLARNATEELLRFVTPARGFGRTATRDTEIRGQEIRAGQRAFCFYMAANMDGEVFPEPRKLDVAREFTSMHLAFGFGQHGCLGAALARLEIRIMLAELVRHFPMVRLTATPVMDRTVLFGNHWSTVSVEFDGREVAVA